MSRLQSRIILCSLFLLLPIINTGGHTAQAQQPLVTAILAQPFNFTLDFEEGSLRGWKPSGTAFQSQPTRDDNPTARNRGQPAKQQGRYWIGTYENYQGRPGQRAGSIQGDDPQGILSSAPFTIPQGKMNFLVGGGSAFETRVELLVNLSNAQEFGYEMVYWAAGRNTETMHRVYWDLTPYVGKKGIIRIIDDSSGGWGHINADDFRFTPPIVKMEPIPGIVVPAPVPVVPIRVTVPQLVGRSVEQAIAIVKEINLSLGEIRKQPADQPPNTVIGQKPGAGTRVVVGTPVYLVVAVEDLVPVPNLIGRDENQALRMLEKARLQSGSVVQGQSGQPPGTVFDQRPQAGSLVKAGSQVDMAIAVTIDVEVPDVTGLFQQEAVQRLTGVGLVGGVITGQPSSSKPDTVLDQQPRPGSLVKKGAAVALLVAVTDLVAVPGVVDMHKDRAVDEIIKARLQEGRVVERQSEKPPGTVIDQRPAAGSRAEAGSHVHMAVAVPIDITVPDVVELLQQEAEKRLHGKGLKTGRITKRPSPEQPGKVLDQKPAAGMVVQAGAAVDLLVAVPDMVAVPRVMDMHKDRAFEQIIKARLQEGRVQERQSGKPPGTVLDQRPAEGSQVKAGSQVHIVVAVPEIVAVPNLVGMSRDEAIRLLYQQRFKLGSIVDRPAAEQLGTIVVQQPAAGSQVLAGSPVDLVVAAKILVPVPGVVGMQRQEALDRLSAAGLAGGIIKEQESDTPAGTVLEQQPIAGQLVARNTAVSLVIAGEKKALLPWYVYAGIVGGIIAAAGAAGAFTARFRKGKGRGADVGGPRLEVSPRYDPGKQTVRPAGSRLTDFEIKIKAQLDKGTQTLQCHGALIDSEVRT
jgi:beta-lactam-binding protein with PASTA domain